MIFSFQLHSEQISAIKFFKNGRFIVSAGKDRRITVFDVSKKRVVHAFEHENPVNTVDVASDGSLIAAAGRNGETVFWSFPDGKKVFGTKDGGKSILSIAISPDKTLAVSSDENGIVTEREIKTGKIIRTFTENSGAVNAVAFSDDGRMFVSAGKEVVVRNTSDSQKIMDFELQYAAYSVAFERGGEFFSVSDGAIIKRYPVIHEMWKQDPAELLEETQKEAGKRLEGFKLIPF